MSNPYPSRRELRLQRQREERAELRDEEAQRWAEEVEDREQRAAERQASETLAKVEPVPASESSKVSLKPAQFDQQQDDNGVGRRAANKPVAAPADVDEPVEDELTPRRRRRADSQVTSTGMLPLITKRRAESADSKPKPGSRREAREHAQLVSANRHHKINDLKAQQEEQQHAVPPKPVRRATAPQAPPPPIPAVEAEPASFDDPMENDAFDESPKDTVVLSTWEGYEESDVEITDMSSGLDTLEIRRAELRDETEELTQEIIQLGQENPNVIDPLLLRRQKELAEKSQELQDLETSVIEIVEDEDHQNTVSEAATEAGTRADTSVDDVVPEEVIESDERDVQPARRARRASSGPMMTGPFEVADEDEPVEAAEAETKPDFAEHFESDLETYATPITGPEQPLGASSAHGLDTLDPKESEAPERLILAISIAVFAIGIIALIIALILLNR